MTPSAYPEQKPPKSGMLGWRCVVQGKRGSSAKGTQQIMVHGTWFHLRDTDRIRSVSQREGGAEGEEREEGEEGEERDEGDEGDEGEEGEGGEGDERFRGRHVVLAGLLEPVLCEDLLRDLGAKDVVVIQKVSAGCAQIKAADLLLHGEAPGGLGHRAKCKAEDMDRGVRLMSEERFREIARALCKDVLRSAQDKADSDTFSALLQCASLHQVKSRLRPCDLGEPGSVVRALRRLGLRCNSGYELRLKSPKETDKQRVMDTWQTLRAAKKMLKESTLMTPTPVLLDLAALLPAMLPPLDEDEGGGQAEAGDEEAGQTAAAHAARTAPEDATGPLSSMEFDTLKEVRPSSHHHHHTAPPPPCSLLWHARFFASGSAESRGMPWPRRPVPRGRVQPGRSREGSSVQGPGHVGGLFRRRTLQSSLLR